MDHNRYCHTSYLHLNHQAPLDEASWSNGSWKPRRQMDEDGCPTRTCCCLSVSSPATFPKSAVSMHRGSIKLKGSGSVSLFPDCQELSSRKDNVRKDPPLMFWGTVRRNMAEAFEHPKHILSTHRFRRAPLEIAHHISYNAFLACDVSHSVSKTIVIILDSLDHCKEI